MKRYKQIHYHRITHTHARTCECREKEKESQIWSLFFNGAEILSASYMYFDGHTCTYFGSFYQPVFFSTTAFRFSCNIIFITFFSLEIHTLMYVIIVLFETKSNFVVAKLNFWTFFIHIRISYFMQNPAGFISLSSFSSLTKNIMAWNFA